MTATKLPAPRRAKSTNSSSRATHSVDPKQPPATGRRRRSTGAGVTCSAELMARWRQLRDAEIDYVPHADFDDEPPAAYDAFRAESSNIDAASPASTAAVSRSAAPYLMQLGAVALLSADEEISLFRRMNHLKHAAARLRATIDDQQPCHADVERVEHLLSEAVAIRNHLIAANLRLVVSVAKKYVDAANSLAELISDGNMSLMRAVVKFDFGRGFRFSTYATWALRYNFSRSLSTQRQRRSRIVGNDEQVQEIADERAPSTAPAEARYDRLQSALAGMLNRLDRRERAIIQQRFGFGRDQEEQTLQQIANEMGVCKERVRQLQLRAMEKLRGLIAEANLLVEVENEVY